MPEFIGLKDKLAKLEERVYAHDTQFAEQQTVIDTTNFNMQMLKMTVDDHEKRLTERIY